MNGIKYDGVEFSTVQQLYEYRQLEKQNGDNKVHTSKWQKWIDEYTDDAKMYFDAPDKHKQYKRKGGYKAPMWSEHQHKVVVEAMKNEDNLNATGRLNNETCARLAKYLDRTPAAVYNRSWQITRQEVKNG